MATVICPLVGGAAGALVYRLTFKERTKTGYVLSVIAGSTAGILCGTYFNEVINIGLEFTAEYFKRALLRDKAVLQNCLEAAELLSSNCTTVRSIGEELIPVCKLYQAIENSRVVQFLKAFL